MSAGRHGVFGRYSRGHHPNTAAARATALARSNATRTRCVAEGRAAAVAWRERTRPFFDALEAEGYYD